MSEKAELPRPKVGLQWPAVPTDPLLPLLDLPGVAEAAADARDAVDRLLGHRVLRRASARVSGESALRGARASAALEGALYPLEQVRAGAVQNPVLRGAMRVHGELGSLVETWPRAPRQVLARLHLLAAAGIVDEPLLGRPAQSTAVSVRLGELAALLTADRDPRVPAVVLAAVVQAELLTMAAFAGPNGVVARAAFRLTAISRGLDPKAVLVPEVGHLELAEEYRAAADGYAAGSAEGVAVWLRHCCAAVRLGAREGLAICEGVLRG